MTKRMQIYYNALFGAIGGLLGWFIIGSFRTETWNIWLASLFIGAGVGLFIGLSVGAVEGVVIKGSPVQAMRGGLSGAVIGLASGMIGLLLGEAVFLLIQGGLIARSLGWMSLGLLLGLGQGLLDRRSNRRITYSTVGGTIAGLVGGLIYELLTQVFLSQSGRAQVWLGGLGLILIGASLGGIIPLSMDVFRRITQDKGTLVVRAGRKKGLEVSILDSVRLGSYDGCEVYLPGDPGIAKEHARVAKTADGFWLTNLGGVTRVNGRPVPDAGYRLKDGDVIQLGSTRVEFQAR